MHGVGGSCAKCNQRMSRDVDRVITQMDKGRAVPVRRALAQNEHSARGGRSDREA
jgi:hypothetical protein